VRDGYGSLIAVPYNDGLDNAPPSAKRHVIRSRAKRSVSARLSGNLY